MHGILRDMFKGVLGVEDVVMGLDANLRQSQQSSVASHPEDPLADRSLLAPACAAVPGDDPRHSPHLDKDGFASDQDGELRRDPVGDAFLAIAE